MCTAKIGYWALEILQLGPWWHSHKWTTSVQHGFVIPVLELFCMWLHIAHTVCYAISLCISGDCRKKKNLNVNCNSEWCFLLFVNELFTPFKYTFFPLLTFIYCRRLITFIMLLLLAQILSKKIKKWYWSEYLYCRWSLLFALVDRIQYL